MALTFRFGRDGALRMHWYGVYTEHGKRKVMALEEPMVGNPPDSLSIRDPGNAEFEESRRKAQLELDAYSNDAQRKGRAEHLTERLIESKTGRAVKYVRIDQLAARWRTMGRKVIAGKRHLANCDAHFGRFVKFMVTQNEDAEYLYQVTPEDAAAYVAHVQGQLSPATAQYGIRMLSKSMTRFLPVGAANPFLEFVGGRSHSESGVVHRKPFTAEELRALLDATRNDKFLYPLIVTAACSGMRRGDVCQLKWSDVDLAGGMLTVKTSKTEAEVEIPIFSPLRKVLEGRKRDKSGFVFPEAAKRLETHPKSLTWEFKKAVARSFGPQPESDEEPAPRVEPADIREEALAAIQAEVPEGKKRTRMLDVLNRYCDGKSFRDIAAATGCSKGTLSLDLHEVQDMIKKPFLPHREGLSIVAEVKRVTRVARKGGKKSASIRDWHALRTTFVTLALSANVPLELVRRVTGHATVEVVLKHYFRPDREQFRAALFDAMPAVLTGAKGSKLLPKDELSALAAKIVAGTATDEDKARLHALTAK